LAATTRIGSGSWSERACFKYFFKSKKLFSANILSYRDLISPKSLFHYIA
jgi:hypothetical protein